MAKAVKHKKCCTVKALREFIKDLPDTMPIRGYFAGDRIAAVVWAADAEESGPRKYLSFEAA